MSTGQRSLTLPAMEVVTTAEVAKMLRVSAQRVRQLAEARGIEPAMIVGTAKVWHRRDLPRFERRPPGRPRA